MIVYHESDKAGITDNVYKLMSAYSGYLCQCVYTVD